MSHVRQQIRELAVTLLSAAAPPGTSVKQGMAYPVRPADLPVLVVYTPSEASEAGSISPGSLVRVLDLVVRGADRVDYASKIEDALDALAVLAELNLTAAGFGAAVKSISIRETAVELSGDGDQAIGEIELTFEVIYSTAQADPETAL